VQLRIWLSLAFLTGLVIAYPPNRTWSVWCLVTVVLCVSLWTLSKTRWTWALGFLLAFGAGLLYMGWVEGMNRSAIAELLPTEKQASFTVDTRGTLITAPHIDGDRVRFVFLVQELTWQGKTFAVREKVQVTLRLQTAAEVPPVSRWRPGDQLSMPLRLSVPDGARNPGAFDYRRYLHEQRIHWLGEGRGLSAVSWESSSTVRGMAHDVRQQLARVLDELYTGDTAGLLKGLLLGQRDAVPLPLEEAYSSLGMAHILAISGGHVAIVVALGFFFFQLLGISRERAIGWLLLVLPVYAWMTGLEVPVIRAAVMAAMALWALWLNRPADHVQSLFLTAGWMAIWNPYWLFQASFQLSFFITFGLILWTDRLAQTLQRWLGFKKWWTPFSHLLALNVVAQWVSFPLVIAYFHEYSLLSTVANLTVVSILSLFVIPLGYVTLLLGWIHPGAAYMLAQLNQRCCEWLWALTAQMAEWRFLVTVWPTPSLVWIVVFYVFGAWWMSTLSTASPLPGVESRRARRQTAGWRKWFSDFSLRRVPARLILLFMAGWLWVGYLPHATWERGVRVTFLDVGQGDAVVVETPREVWLIDSGGRMPWQPEPWQQREDMFDVGEDVVLPYLQHRGIRRLDGIVLTHGDADHVQGFLAVVRRLQVRMAIVNGGPSTPVQEEVLALLRERGVPVYRAEAGQRWSTEKGIQWEVLHPSTAPAVNDNRHSVVLRLNAYGREVLLTGDVDVQGEMDILASGRLRPADVLKVAHHGSKTSTSDAWLSAVQPELAVISVGKNNLYGHPSPAVLKRLAASDIPVVRTDRDGAVTLRFYPDGQWQVWTQLSGSTGLQEW